MAMAESESELNTGFRINSETSIHNLVNPLSYPATAREV